MPDPLVIAPRRIIASSRLSLLPEVRAAWRVPDTEPFTVNHNPDWRVLGVLLGSLSFEYEAEAYAPERSSIRMQDVAEEAVDAAVASPKMRWVVLEQLSEPVHPADLAFSLEDARARARDRAAAADTAKEDRS